MVRTENSGVIAPPALDRYRAAVDAELRHVLAQWESPLSLMMRYHLGWVNEDGSPRSGSGGKGLRSTLCLLSCEALGGSSERALPAAAAVELVHNFSLVHDDIQDDDRLRRHRPTVWSIWGKPQAINAGTAMRILAGLALSRLGERAVSVDRQLQVRHLVDESSLQLIEGQYLDISYERRLDVGVEDYTEMIRKKTGMLTACAAEVGAVLASDDPGAHRRFHDFGMNLGVAFQIRDDILGIWGDEECTGKPMGSDIQRRKKTLPLVYALQQAQGQARERLARIYRADTLEEDAVSSVLQTLESIGARAQAQQLAEQFRDRALDDLAATGVSALDRRELEHLAHFLVIRDF
jgi:geranylgeranyl diphosphate synthase type I